MELQQELVKRLIPKKSTMKLPSRFLKLENSQQATMDTVQSDEQISHITDLQDFIKAQTADLTEFDEALVKRWLKQITVWPDHCTVELKSGVSVDIDR